MIESIATKKTPDQIADYWADWLVDAFACSLQDRRFLRGDTQEEPHVCDALYANGKKAILNALRGEKP